MQYLGAHRVKNYPVPEMQIQLSGLILSDNLYRNNSRQKKWLKVVVSAMWDNGIGRCNPLVWDVKEDYENVHLLVYNSTNINLNPATLIASTLVFLLSILQKATRVIDPFYGNEKHQLYSQGGLLQHWEWQNKIPQPAWPPTEELLNKP